MGLIGNILGGARTVEAVGDTVREVAEVFTPNATRAQELSAQATKAALDQMAAEFDHAPMGWFDRMVDGLNRLPRPMLAFGTLGLFAYAMADPDGFTRRMVGLNAVPEPMWWLLAAIVGFYFGAREAHYFRSKPVFVPAVPAATPPDGAAALPAPPAGDGAQVRLATPPNAAIEDWRRARAARDGV
jgi:hypothetical protein